MDSVKLGSRGIPEGLGRIVSALKGWAKQTAIETGQAIETTDEERGALAIVTLAKLLVEVYEVGENSDLHERIRLALALEPATDVSTVPWRTPVERLRPTAPNAAFISDFIVFCLATRDGDHPATQEGLTRLRKRAEELQAKF